MKKIYSLLLILTACLLISISSQSTSYALKIKSSYASTNTCNYVTGGSYIIWWDKKFALKASATNALNYLKQVEADCLSHKFEKQLSTKDGYYINVYLANPNSLFGKYGFVGKNTVVKEFGKYSSLVITDVNKKNTFYHEAFHSFQLSTPNIAIKPVYQWFLEAQAYWYSFSKHPNDTNEFTLASLYAVPHIPIWYSAANSEVNAPLNDQRKHHKYQVGTFLYYLTKAGYISNYDMARTFVDLESNQSPFEYFYNKVGAAKISQLFVDWAAHVRAGADGFPSGTMAMTNQSLLNYTDKNDFHQYIRVYNNTGTNGTFVRPNISDVTRSWGFNVFKTNNKMKKNYTFTLLGDSKGSNGTPSVFNCKIAIKNAKGVTYQNLIMETNKLNGKKTISVTSTDSEIYFIIASTPKLFEGNERFSYRLKIS